MGRYRKAGRKGFRKCDLPCCDVVGFDAISKVGKNFKSSANANRIN